MNGTYFHFRSRTLFYITLRCVFNKHNAIRLFLVWVHNVWKQKRKKKKWERENKTRKNSIISIYCKIIWVTSSALKWAFSDFLRLLHIYPCLFMYACMQSLHFNYVNTFFTLCTCSLQQSGFRLDFNAHPAVLCALFSHLKTVDSNAKKVCLWTGGADFATCGLNYIYLNVVNKADSSCTSEAHMQTHI